LARRLNVADTVTEARLAEAAALGDIDAFERLVREHQGAVRALLRRIADDPATADDVCQAAFIQAWRKLAEFRGGSFRAWVCSIAYRLHARQWRRSGKPPFNIDEMPEAHTPSPGAGIDLDRAIAELAPVQRHAIVLSCVVGMSHAEIAEATGWPLGTVKSHIQRAKTRLREQLEGYEGEQ
jgi:RNA polymerase sigma factor (sigma-70 family)